MGRLFSRAVFFGITSFSLCGQADVVSQLGQQYEQPIESKALAYQVKEPTLPDSDQPIIGPVLNFQGVTVNNMPAGVDFTNLVAPFKGKSITFEGLSKLAQTMTRQLRNKGHLLAQVILPPQQVKDGQVTYQVINGFIDQIIYEGETEVLSPALRRVLDSLRHQKPLERAVLERALLLVARTPGVAIKVVFKPSETSQDATNLIVRVKKDWGGIMTGVNNEMRREDGPWQAYAGLTLNNLFDEYGQFNLIAAKSLENYKMQHISLSYDVPVNEDGLRVILKGQVSQTKPSGLLRILRKKNQYEDLQVGVKYPIFLGRHEQLDGELMLQIAKNESLTRLTGQKQVDHLRVLYGALTYDFADHLGGVNVWKISMSQGIAGALGASDNSSPLKTRANSRFDFFKLNAEIYRAQDLGDGLSLSLHGQGQLGTHTLPSSQKFYFGLSPYNRGYEMSILGSDSAVNGSIGLSYTDRNELGITRIYTNIGQGYAWIRQPTPDEKRHISLASMDVGVEHQLEELNGTAYIVYGKPLRRRLFGQKAQQRAYIGFRMNW